MLDNDVVDTQLDTGCVSLFVPENEYETIEVPVPVEYKVESPGSVLLGVPDDVLENTLFTRIKLDSSDFTRTLRRNISLLLVKQNVVEKTPYAISGLSPAFIVLEGRSYLVDGLFTRQTSESLAKIKTLLKDHFLLLPLYLTVSGGVKPQGVNIALRNFYGGEAGRLWAKGFSCADIYIFGQSYFSLPETKCCGVMGRSLYDVWRYWYIFRDIAEKLRMGMVDYDINQIATRDYLKFGEDELKCE